MIPSIALTPNFRLRDADIVSIMALARGARFLEPLQHLRALLLQFIVVLIDPCEVFAFTEIFPFVDDFFEVHGSKLDVHENCVVMFSLARQTGRLSQIFFSQNHVVDLARIFGSH